MKTIAKVTTSVLVVGCALTFGAFVVSAQTCVSQSSMSATTTRCSDGTTSLTFQSPSVTETVSSNGSDVLSTQSGVSTFATGTDGDTTTDAGGLQVGLGPDASLSSRTCLGNGLSTSPGSNSLNTRSAVSAAGCP